MSAALGIPMPPALASVGGPVAVISEILRPGVQPICCGESARG